MYTANGSMEQAKSTSRIALYHSFASMVVGAVLIVILYMYMYMYMYVDLSRQRPAYDLILYPDYCMTFYPIHVDCSVPSNCESTHMYMYIYTSTHSYAQE